MNNHRLTELSKISSAILLKEKMPYKGFITDHSKGFISGRKLNKKNLEICQKWCDSQVKHPAYKISTAVLSITQESK